AVADVLAEPEPDRAVMEVPAQAGVDRLIPAKNDRHTHLPRCFWKVAGRLVYSAIASSPGAFTGPAFPMSDVTVILSAIEPGDPRAAAQLLPLVYDELRRLAAQRLAREKPGQTLDATALVHEAYLRLVACGDRDQLPWNHRGHFFAAAAEAMRRILVE